MINVLKKEIISKDFEFLKKNQIELPNYLDYSLKEKWLHIGLGNFHRSHQAFYLHKLLNKKKSKYSLISVELKNNNLVNNLKKQDYLYTLINKDNIGKDEIVKSYIIGSITSAYFINDKNISVINSKIEQNDINLITLTVTENGYHEINGDLDLNSKDLSSDLEINTCHTIYGLLYRIISERLRSNLNINILSCDNISNNGEMLSKLFLQFCEIKNKALSSWIIDHVFFPNTMVDRITPKHNIDNVEYLENKYNYIDNCVIESEPYIQWIIEENNCDLLNIYDLDVEIVKDVKPYQEMKMLMLNASHCSTSFLSVLNNFKYVYETFNNMIFCDFIESYLVNDVIPNLKKGFYDYSLFKNIILKRFSNKGLKDTTIRTTINGSKNLEIFIKPSFKKCFENKMSTTRYALIYCSWLVFLEENYIKNKLKDINDDNYEYICDMLTTNNFVEMFINDNRYPGISNMVDERFLKEFYKIYNLLKEKKIYEAIKYSI